MAATIIINRLTGAGPTATPITGINTRANAEDAHSTAGTSNSILVPSAGTNYSYWVHTRLECTAITSGTVDNLKWYTDGSNNLGTGVTCVGESATSYVQATGTPGSSGDQLTAGAHAGLAGAPSDVFAYTSGSPKSISGSTTTVQQFGDRMVYQIEVGTTAASGATGQETFTWRYDDTSS